MPIEFPCSSCGAKLRVPDGTSGKKAKCPTCETSNIVPDDNGEQTTGSKSVPKPSFEFSCSSCGAKLRVPEGTSGKKAKCPSCQTVNVVPGVASLPPQVSNPNSAESMPSPLDDPFGLKDEGHSKSMGNQDWGIDDFAESDNPFQAPHDFDGVPGPATAITDTITPSKLYFGQAIRETFRSFFSNFLAYLLTALAMILSYGAIYAIAFAGIFVMFPQLIRPDANPETVGATVILTFFPFIIFIMIAFGLLGTGFLSCFISVAKTGKASVNVFVKGMKKFLPCFGYGLILWLVNVGLAVLQEVTTVGIAIGANGNDGGILTLIVLLIAILLAILNFWINFRLMWGFWLIIDQNFSVGNALRITREISKGNAMTGFVLFLAVGFLVGLWFLLMILIPSVVMGLGDTFQVLGAVMLGVLCIFSGLLAMPFFACLYTIMYFLMSGQHPSVQQPDTEW